MNKVKRFVVAFCLIILGGGICFGAYAINGFKIPSGRFGFFNIGSVNLGEADYEKKELVLDKRFSNIYYNGARELDVRICKSDRAVSYIEYYDTSDLEYQVSIENNDLKVQCDDRRGNVSFIFGGITKIENTIYLSESDYEKFVVKTSSGSITIKDEINVKVVEVEASSGDTDIKDIKVDDLSVRTSSGENSVKNVVGKNVTILSSSGDNVLENITGENLSVASKSGSDKIKNCKVTVISTESSSGDIEYESINAGKMNFSATSGEITGEDVIVSETMEGDTSSGNIEIDSLACKNISCKTSSGSIELKLSGEPDYIFETHTSSGDVDVPLSKTGSENTCKLETSSGDITVR